MKSTQRIEVEEAPEIIIPEKLLNEEKQEDQEQE